MLRVYIYYYFVAYLLGLISTNTGNFVMNEVCSKTFVSNRLSIKIGDLFFYYTISTHPAT